MKVLKSMPNGKDYIIFYLSLMLESVETVGHLRFTSLVPYNDEMLAAITETNVDIVRSSCKSILWTGINANFWRWDNLYASSSKNDRKKVKCWESKRI